MYKRLLSMLLIAVMALGLCAAASASDVSGEINFWCAYNAKQGMGDIIDAFQAKYPGVKVNLTVANNSTDGNLLIDTALMGGGQIDVMLCYGGNRMEERSTSGYYEDLTDRIAAEGWDMEALWGIDARFTAEQRQYGIPVDALIWYMAINMTEWKAAGYDALPTAWTWDEYIEASRKMTKEGMFGGCDGFDGGANWRNHLNQVFGADVAYNEEGKSSVLTNPMWKEVIEMKYQNEVVDKIWQPFTEMRANNITVAATLLNKLCASTVCCNIWRFIMDTETYPIDFQVGFAPYPTAEAGQTNYVEGPNIYGYICMTEDCKNKDAAWEFIKFFATEGNAFMLKSGHLCTYVKADKDAAIEYIFGSLESAEKLIDVESFKNVVLNFDGQSYNDTIIGKGGTDKLMAYQIDILSGNYTIDEGLKALEEETNSIIEELAE